MMFYYDPNNNSVLNDFVRSLFGECEFIKMPIIRCFVCLDGYYLTDFPIYYLVLKLRGLFSRKRIFFLNLEIWGFDVEGDSLKRKLRNILFRRIVRTALRCSKTVLILPSAPRKEFYQYLVAEVKAEIMVVENVV